jgi:hypothetical protein
MDKIEIKGRQFVFGVPTPFEGCAIYDKITNYDIPFGAFRVMGLKSIKRPMPQDELEIYLKLCLKNCYEIIKTETGENKIAVIDSDNEIAINNLDSTMITKLATQYMVFFMEWWQEESL